MQERDWQAADFASRTMRWTGVIVALFVLFHLADLTWGTANPDFVRGDVYRNFVATFSRPPVAIIYLIGNVALGIHLFHGTWSLFQSLGLNNPKWNAWRRTLRHRARGAHHRRERDVPDRGAHRHRGRRRQPRLQHPRRRDHQLHGVRGGEAAE